jgi:hypothetical protein
MRGFALLMVVISSGCAAGNTAPFHVYQSPLLQAEFHPAERRVSQFDPLRVGDFEPAEVQVASTKELKPAEPAVAMGEAPERKAESAKTAKRQAKSVKPKLAAVAPSRVGSRPEDTGRKSLSSESGAGWEPQVATRYVTEVMKANGVELGSSTVSDVYKHCKAAGKVRHADPKVGDIVFFHNVFDASKDGRNNDWYTHVGLVENVEGTVARVVGWRSGGLHTFTLDASRPKESNVGGVEINARLREPMASDPPFTEYHAGQLFAGYCDLLEQRENFVLVEGWQP